MAGEWLTATVESLSRIVCSGGTPRTGVADYYDGGSIPWVTTTEVDYNRIVQTDKCITEAGLAASSAKMVPPGTVIVAMYGRGTAGRVAMAGVPLTTNQACCNLVVDETQADARFVYYSLWSNFSKLDALANGSVQQNLSAGVIRAFEILVPPLSEQRAIAHILGTLDDKIELNRRMARTLEEMARALFKAWFVDFEPVRAKMDGRWRPGESLPGLPAHLYDLFPDHLVDSELGEIPEGWEVGSLDDLSCLNPESWSRKTRPKVVDYVDLSNTKWGWIESVTTYAQEEAPSRAQRVLRPGDTIVGTVRPGNGSYAMVSDEGLTGSTGFAVLRPTSATYAGFVYLTVTATDNIEALSHLADGGAYPAVRPEVVSKTQVVRPETQVLTAFSRITDPLLEQRAANERESRVLVALRDALLPRLISGELRLNDPDRLVEEAAS